MQPRDLKRKSPTYGNPPPGTQAPLPHPTENLIIISASPLLEYLVELKQQFEQGEILSPDVLRKDVRNLIATVENELLKHTQYHTRLDLIKYVLTSLIDEVIIFSPWQYSNDWQAHPLEMELFGKSIAGERFFELLENDGYRDPELARTFFSSVWPLDLTENSSGTKR